GRRPARRVAVARRGVVSFAGEIAGARRALLPGGTGQIGRGTSAGSAGRDCVQPAGPGPGTVAGAPVSARGGPDGRGLGGGPVSARNAGKGATLACGFHGQSRDTVRDGTAGRGGDSCHGRRPYGRGTASNVPDQTQDRCGAGAGGW